MQLMPLVLLVCLGLLAEQPKPETTPQQQIDLLRAENAKLKEQLETLRKAVMLEIRIKDGALQACREAAMEKPRPAGNAASQVP